jgi:threonine/homoserine/homoserine lactone efflux protein
MFSYDLLHWSTFFAAAVLLNLSPGPDMAFILGQTASGGRKAGFSAMFGIWVGAGCHAIAAALGLSALLATSASAFAIMKWIGAAYLVWLGIKALRSAGTSLSGSHSIAGETGSSNERVFRQGIVVSLLNPKVAIFFMAFLPQFVVSSAGPAWLQLLLHGVLLIVVAGFVEPPLILLGDRLSSRIRASRRIGLWLDRSLGSLFIGLGIKLALTER